MKLTERINFRQPKYMLPAIVYLPLLGASYFIFDLFDTKVAEKQDANMQTTEYLNPNLPQAHIKGGDGIGGKYENMLNAYGKIEDHSAVENIDRDNEQEKEEYQSKYSDAELHQGESFPVGKVEFLSLCPMNFIEFVMAMGEKNLAQLIQTKDWNMVTMFAPKFQELLKYYYYVGGMPEAVLSFCQNRDWKEVRTIQKDILNSYQRDMSKHAPSEIIPRITDLWKSLPAQLSKENRKFIYGVVREGARAREYELALQWLLDAGLIYKVYNVKAPRLPLASYEDRAAFKIFVLDVGLLGAMSNLKAATIVAGNTIFTEFKGALTEQYVLQQLILRYEPYYYAKTNSTQEIDFLLQDEEDEIVPLEVKAETNVKAKSLRQFVADNQSKKVYRISMNDYLQEDWVTNVPLYAVNGLEFYSIQN